MKSHKKYSTRKKREANKSQAELIQATNGAQPDISFESIVSFFDDNAD